MAIEELAQKSVPKNFVIVNKFQLYTISWEVGGTFSYKLPSVRLPVSTNVYARLLAPYRDVAVCEVRAPDGVLWLVSRSFDGFLSYILASAAELLNN